MNNKKDDGGPAFPRKFEDGMSLRDWFAGMAMQGMVTTGETAESAILNRIVSQAYAMADAMLKARGK